MTELTLFYFPECPFCQIVLDTISELGIEDKIIFKNTRTSREDYSFLMNTTGRTTVPCLFIDDKPMHESRDICLWLQENKDAIKKI